MAAGLGTRLRPFTSRFPKAFVPVLGVPAIQFALDSLVGAGASRVVVNVHHHAGQARGGVSRLDLGPTPRLGILISDESQMLLGSAGGIRRALPLLGTDAFWVLNADTLCDVDLSALAQAHATLRAERGVTMTLAVHVGGGGSERYREIRFDPETRLLTGLGERASGRPFYTGVGMMEPEAFDHLEAGVPSDFVLDVLGPALQKGRAGVFPVHGEFIDIGSPRLWWLAHLSLIRQLESGQLPTRWRSRLLGSARRVRPGVWVGQEIHGEGEFSRYWKAPCFIGGESVLPCSVDSGVVAYHARAGDLSAGIFFEDLSVLSEDLNQ